MRGADVRRDAGALPAGVRVAGPGQAALSLPVGRVVHRHHDAPPSRSIRPGGGAQRRGRRPPGSAALHARLLPRRETR